MQEFVKALKIFTLSPFSKATIRCKCDIEAGRAVNALRYWMIADDVQGVRVKKNRGTVIFEKEGI